MVPAVNERWEFTWNGPAYKPQASRRPWKDLGAMRDEKAINYPVSELSSGCRIGFIRFPSK
jgi:hypothetical protein